MAEGGVGMTPSLPPPLHLPPLVYTSRLGFAITGSIAIGLVAIIVMLHPEHRDLSAFLLVVNGAVFGISLAGAVYCRAVIAMYRSLLQLHAAMQELFANEAQKSPDPCGPGLSREEPPQQGSR